MELESGVMANSIPELDAAAALAGTEVVWGDQSGDQVKITAQAIANLSGGGANRTYGSVLGSAG